MRLIDRDTDVWRDAGKTPRVLVADDDPTSAALLEPALGRWGIRTVRCSTGREALAEAERNSEIVMAVLNWMLPDLDGHRIAKRIRMRRPSVVTVLMVGQRVLSEAWCAMGLRANYVLTKPLPGAGTQLQVDGLVRLAFGRQIDCLKPFVPDAAQATGLR